MASQYTVGFGSYISYATETVGLGTSSSSTGSYTKIAQTIDLNSPMPEVGDIKITNNDSPNNTHEYAPGLIEPGTLEWEVVYVKSTFETIYAFLGNNSIYSFQETFSDGSVCTFSGYWKTLGVEGKTEDDALKGKMSIKLTSKPVWS
jgi:hypothetical protein